MDVKLSFAALAAEFADVWNDAQNPGTVQSALIDMALLSHCDDLVVTMASSFGYVAAAWGASPQSTWCMGSTPARRTHTGTGEQPLASPCITHALYKVP